MSFDRLRHLVSIIAKHHNRTIDGRKRLQKEIMLLQSTGFPTDYPFSTHFYGAYSEELFSDLKMLERLGIIKEEEVQNGSFFNYKISVKENVKEDIEIDIPNKFGTIIGELEKTTPLILEISATYALYMEKKFSHEQALDVLKRTKPAKATQNNLDSAMELLGKLGILVQPSSR